MDAPWRIELFGGLRAQRGEQLLTRFRTQKTALLLAYLAYHGRRTHSRETLIELLWPESEAELGRHTLSVALSWLRSQLEPVRTSASEASMHASGAIILTDRFAIGLSPTAVVTDVAEFEAAMSAAAETADASEQVRLLTRAVDLYRGPLLAGYYEDWIGPEQQRWEELFFRTLRQLIAQLAQAGTFDHALQYALRAVSADPLREEAHREVMRLYAALGQPAAALRQYHELERLLKQELGVAPSGSTQQLIAEIRRSGVQVFRCSGVQEAATSTPEHGNTPRPERLNARTPERPSLEPVGGAVPLDSPFYVARDTDGEFQEAILRGDSIVLVKGARQVGKTSLLARGLQQARAAGARVVRTDFRAFNAVHFQSAEALLRAVGETIGEQLGLAVMPADVWQSHWGPNPNFRRYLRHQVLDTAATPLVWGLDEVDRLFDCDFGSEIFGLFRSWHNDRALDPAGPWGRLTLAIAYATEAHLFITDLNQSPFNVGTRLTLEDFTPSQVADLNLRYASPLKADSEVARYYRLVGGHPYLVRRGLHEMATHGAGIADLEARAAAGDWIFGDHLRRLLSLLARDPDLTAATREVLRGRPCPTAESFYRLRSAGVIVGASEREAQPRCELYTIFLQRHLP